MLVGRCVKLRVRMSGMAHKKVSAKKNSYEPELARCGRAVAYLVM